MTIQAGQTPIVLRQICNAFTGLIPQDTVPVRYEPKPLNKMFIYADPSDTTKTTLSQAGVYDFGDFQTIRLLEIRGLNALGNITAVIADREDQKTVTLTVGGATPVIDLGALGVEPGDIMILTSPGPVVETYTIAEVVSATVLKTEKQLSDRGLIAADAFAIISPKGVSRYAHTLVSSDTLDVEVSTDHDVTVGTPAANRLIFSSPVALTASQVLKVSTASTNSAGWVDVYAVKGDWF